ncbi:MAG: hypothetical protein H0X04_00245 [Chthoniobacterales bacterium]|nr:hypothetical protein [Chthoniobacterales bacterium]
MPRLESDYRHGLAQTIQSYNGYARALVANALMSGLPDFYIVSRFGTQFTMECKMWRNVNPPKTVEALVKLLQGPQYNVITRQLWGRRAYCPIFAFDGDFDDHDPLGICYLGTFDRILYQDTMDNWAKYFANLGVP